MTIKKEIIKINHQGTTLHLYCALPDVCDKPLPAILIFSPWAGQDDFSDQKAQLMAQKGYIGIEIDLYGQRRVGQTYKHFMDYRFFLRDRIAAIMENLQKNPRIDPQHIIAIGCCFGGLCVLDGVRNNLGLQGGISINGLFSQPDYEHPKTYTAKVMALYGRRDPMITPTDLRSFEHEMDEACEDWQLIAFSQGMQAFTNPTASDEAHGLVYNALLDQRTNQYVDLFLQELLSSQRNNH